MRNGQKLSPRQISSARRAARSPNRFSTRLRQLMPTSYKAGSHGRYLRVDVGGANSTFSREEETLRLGEAARKVSTEIERAMTTAARAQQEIKELERLQNDTVLELTGISKAELCVMLWEAPTNKVSRELGIDVRSLKRICQLYGVPAPPIGYWSTRPDRRAIRMARFRLVKR